MEATQKAMNFILGQNSPLDTKTRTGKLKACYQDDDDGYDGEDYPAEDHAYTGQPGLYGSWLEHD